MASAVLAKRYTAAPGRPNRANQKIGATTESLRFSASVSMALSRTSSALKPAISRLTSQRRRSRPAASDSPRASSTACTSRRSMAQASRGLSARPINTAASHHGNCSSAHCKAQDTIKTIAAPASQARVPRLKVLRSRTSGDGEGNIEGAGSTCGATRLRYSPIHTTGCQRAGGSPQ